MSSELRTARCCILQGRQRLVGAADTASFAQGLGAGRALLFGSAVASSRQILLLT